MPRLSTNAPRLSGCTDLSFDEKVRISFAKVLAYYLDESRLNRLTHEEYYFHVFYQSLTGALERGTFGIEDVFAFCWSS